MGVVGYAKPSSGRMSGEGKLRSTSQGGLRLHCTLDQKIVLPRVRCNNLNVNLETGFHVAQPGFEHNMQARMILNFSSSCLHLPSAGISTCHRVDFVQGLGIEPRIFVYAG